MNTYEMAVTVVPAWRLGTISVLLANVSPQDPGAGAFFRITPLKICG